MDLKNTKTIFLDYDGTIHQSLAIYEPAFKKAYAHLVEQGYVEAKDWHQDDIKQFLGQRPHEMWESFGQDLSQTKKDEASQIISDTMKTMIQAGQAVLYDGAMDVLNTLKNRGYRLVFISNCKRYYMDEHRMAFAFETIFDAMYCTEDFNYASKTDILKQVLPQYQGESVIVGDRYYDIQAGIMNNITTIGCRYGFGTEDEIKDADIIMHNIHDLLTLFKPINEK